MHDFLSSPLHVVHTFGEAHIFIKHNIPARYTNAYLKTGKVANDTYDKMQVQNTKHNSTDKKPKKAQVKDLFYE